jgi:hypothetical protein
VRSADQGRRRARPHQWKLPSISGPPAACASVQSWRNKLTRKALITAGGTGRLRRFYKREMVGDLAHMQPGNGAQGKESRELARGGSKECRLHRDLRYRRTGT